MPSDSRPRRNHPSSCVRSQVWRMATRGRWSSCDFAGADDAVTIVPAPYFLVSTVNGSSATTQVPRLDHTARGSDVSALFSMMLEDDAAGAAVHACIGTFSTSGFATRLKSTFFR